MWPPVRSATLSAAVPVCKYVRRGSLEIRSTGLVRMRVRLGTSGLMGRGCACRVRNYLNIDCPNSLFEQVTTTNRTCETACIAGQYGNPLTHVCLTDPQDCPSGYYGDDSTTMCEEGNSVILLSLPDPQLRSRQRHQNVPNIVHNRLRLLGRAHVRGHLPSRPTHVFLQPIGRDWPHLRRQLQLVPNQHLRRRTGQPQLRRGLHGHSGFDVGRHRHQRMH